mmetsp:Transcript_72748/g.116059  ORF Transcript_72748/g.116059 Transcript_72748/m.116059 type:complete len:176 (+) Transcript_72748:78-605(+)
MSDTESQEASTGEEVEEQSSNVEFKKKKSTNKTKSKSTKAQLKVLKRKKDIKDKRARRERIQKYRAKSATKFQIRCRKPVEDEIFDVDEFVKYIKEHFKVDGKTGAVGPGRPVNVQKSVSTVHVMSKQPFPKYYLKFLTKRYLKRHGLRDYVRVIADKKSSYELRYFNIQSEKQQ